MREDDAKSQGRKSNFSRDRSDIFNVEYRPEPLPREPAALVQKFNFSAERNPNNSHYRSAAKVQGQLGAAVGNVGNLQHHKPD